MKNISAKEVREPNENLELFLFNVGQGDHMLLKFPCNEYGIIDFFYESSDNADDTGVKIVEPPALTYFKALKENMLPEEFNKITISFLCISHFDRDHITGICETVDWFDKAGVFIRQIWLAAAENESELVEFLKHRIEKVMSTRPAQERFECGDEFENYKSYVSTFFKSFKKWQEKKFKSPRYQQEYSGKGEYLVEIKPLMPPCTSPQSEATNIGPLTGQLKEYYQKLTYEIIQKIIGFKDKGVSLDGNMISHILKLLFGEKVLMFGGDTETKIWTECIELYNTPFFRYPDKLGQLPASFVKVSHHGSRHSTDKVIWREILETKGKVFLGISAGQHNGYKHPHSETLEDIREHRPDASILATNICQYCVLNSQYPQEFHSWYGKTINESRKDGNDEEKSFYDQEIDKLLDETNIKDVNEDNNSYGLLAYILEIPSTAEKDITVRLALTEKILGKDCFYKDHRVKLCQLCS